MAVYKELLKKFGEGKEKVCIHIDPKNAFNVNHLFKDHRKYIEFLFKQRGLEVIQHNHNYDANGDVAKCGLIYARTDSDIDAHMEVWGIVDVSVKVKDVIAAGE
jgi:hypothetical protein